MEQKNPNNRNRRNIQGLLTVIAWSLFLVVLFNYAGLMVGDRTKTSCEIDYSAFLDMVEQGNVTYVAFSESSLVITPKEGYVFTDANGKEHKENYQLITSDLYDDSLYAFLRSHDVDFTKPYVAQMSPLMLFFVNYILPTVIMVGAFMLIMRLMSKHLGKMGGMGGFGGIGNAGKSRAKVYMEKSTGVTFLDVAGQDEAKESLEEIIDFLHNPERYTAIGAKLPKGALLVGSPGTGKTLLAKAVAGEANVPFFSISGSDFVEMFVGVGASRVRDLFSEAAKVAPCIIFIDEIDTIGKRRDSGRFGSNDEREQTLNQLLAELDGFDPTKGIIVLGATNRPEILDKALLRPGRFDRRITIDRPNLAGRLKTLEVHTRNIKLAEDVDLQKIAQATAGCVGADLANLVNEAALRAVRKGRAAVNQNDLLASFEVVIAGMEKKGTVITEQEKRMIAYHEVGHALAAHMQKDTPMPVSKITIVPHTRGALGYTLHLPEEEKFLMTQEDILAEITCLLAGRAAEELIFNSKSSGAANDIERATELARNFVARFGMSDEFDMVALGTTSNPYLDGTYSMACAEETYAAVDRAVVDLIRKCHANARSILEKNRALMDKIATYLLEQETITGQEMLAIIEGRDPKTVDNYGAKREEDNVPLHNFRPSQPDRIEPPAKHISITSKKIPMPPIAGSTRSSRPSEDVSAQGGASQDDSSQNGKKSDTNRGGSGFRPGEVWRSY